MITIREITYNGWNHCIEMKNAQLKLIVTTEVGPRIIYCSAADTNFNLFHQRKEQQGKTDGNEWHIYGGHRLWHSPQIGTRPNQLDNEKVPYTIERDSLSLICPEETATKVQKQLQVKLDGDNAHVIINHRIYNRGMWPIQLAPWGLTVMREGGIEILPIPQDSPPDFMPNYAICYWPWTKPNDHRFTIGEKYMILRHDGQEERWFKIGYRNTEGWGAYLQNGYMFVKVYKLIPGEVYPDYGSSFETYTDKYMLELESLGPLKNLEPGDYVEHIEEWHLFSNVSIPKTEEEIEENITKRIRGII